MDKVLVSDRYCRYEPEFCSIRSKRTLVVPNITNYNVPSGKMPHNYPIMPVSKGESARSPLLACGKYNVSYVCFCTFNVLQLIGNLN